MEERVFFVGGVCERRKHGKREMVSEMDRPLLSGGESWVMIPNTPSSSHNTTSTPTQTLQSSASNQDLSHLHQQQHFHYQQHHQSLASHFHLLHLVENLADVIEDGTRDQHSDVLISELTTNFDKCQSLLNWITGTIKSKTMTVEGQKHKVEESEQLLNQRRELIAKYRGSVEELMKYDR